MGGQTNNHIVDDDQYMKNRRSNNKVLSAILETLKELTEARNREEKEAWQACITNQWQNMAVFYDRIALVCFMVSVIGVTVWLVVNEWSEWWWTHKLNFNLFDDSYSKARWELFQKNVGWSFAAGLFLFYHKFFFSFPHAPLKALTK